MIQITRITIWDPQLPPRICRHEVHLSAVSTYSSQHREAKAARKGYPPNICGAKATFIVNGIDMCRSHAATSALNTLCPPREVKQR